MLHVTKNKRNGTILYAEPGRILLNLGGNFDEKHTEGLFSVVEEILADLKDKKFKGKFKFDGDFVDIELDTGKDNRKWRKSVI